MPTTEQYQGLLTQLVKARPGDARLHDLVLTAATLPGQTKTATEMLTALITHGKPSREVLEQLTRGTSLAVRRAAWSVTGVWTPEDLAAMVATERTPAVRRAVLCHPGLDESTYRAAFGPNSDTGEAQTDALRYTAIVILQAAQNLPIALVVDALRRFYPIPADGMPNQIADLVAATLAMPGIGYAVATDPTTPPWLAIVAATRLEVDAETMHAVLSTLLVNGIDASSAGLTAHPALGTPGITARLHNREDLTWATAMAVRLLLPPEAPFDPERAAVADLPPAARGWRRWALANHSSESSVTEAWKRISAEERSVELCEEVLLALGCSAAVFTEAAAVLGLSSEADAAALLDRVGPVTGAGGRWLALFPQLALRELRKCDARAAALRAAGFQCVDESFYDMFIADVAASPDAWAPGTLSSAVEVGVMAEVLSDASIALLPATALMAVATSHAGAADRLITELWGLNSDPERASARTRALLEVLDDTPHSVAALVEAVGVAAG